MRVRQHPVLGILVGTDGYVMVPANGKHPAIWTLGCKHNRGYRQVSIAGKHYLVHRLVAETFLGGIPEGMEIDHINRVRDDNRLENIRIVTSSENHRNTRANDRVDARGGTHKYEDLKQYKRESGALYRAENKDKVREGQSRYYAENKDKVREQHARYRAENIKKIREHNSRYYAENKEKERLRKAQYKEAKCKTHRVVYFADGSRHYIPNEEAIILLAIPLKERHYGK